MTSRRHLSPVNSTAMFFFLFFSSLLVRKNHRLRRIKTRRNIWRRFIHIVETRHPISKHFTPTKSWTHPLNNSFILHFPFCSRTREWGREGERNTRERFSSLFHFPHTDNLTESKLSDSCTKRWPQLANKSKSYCTSLSSRNTSCGRAIVRVSHETILLRSS